MTNFLEALSPIDGRYVKQTQALREFFSELALFRYRVRVEIEYLIELSQVGLPNFPSFNPEQRIQLRSLYTEFTKEHAEQIKQIEHRTNHDIKAVEYFIKDKLEALGLSEWKEWVHFGLTSQDINNTAIPLSMKEAAEHVIFPGLVALQDKIKELAIQWKDVSMLARTHGQAASPTTVGKELYVFAERLQIQIRWRNGKLQCAQSCFSSNRLATIRN